MLSPIRKLQVFWPQVALAWSGIGTGGLGAYLLTLGHGIAGGMTIALCAMTGVVTLVTTIGKIDNIQENDWPRLEPKECRTCVNLTRKLTSAEADLAETRQALVTLKVD